MHIYLRFLSEPSGLFTGQSYNGIAINGSFACLGTSGGGEPVWTGSALDGQFTCDVSSGATGFNIWNTFFAGMSDLLSRNTLWDMNDISLHAHPSMSIYFQLQLLCRVYLLMFWTFLS